MTPLSMSCLLNSFSKIIMTLLTHAWPLAEACRWWFLMMFKNTFLLLYEKCLFFIVTLSLFFFCTMSRT
uniref:Uncharacterized protein n=1 Tax=Aegilops tauschii subsp. strangulata TaxID=200361 RepID=A0A453H189_AEGTS